MKEILSKQSKETRCYIMAAIMVFQGYEGVDEMTEIFGEMKLDVLSLSKEDLERFPIPQNISQIVNHLKLISDPEVRDYVITNTYSPVLKSRRRDALSNYRAFCRSLGWPVKEIKESMEMTEEIYNMKPVDNGIDGVLGPNQRSGCLSVIALVILSTILLAFSTL